MNAEPRDDIDRAIDGALASFAAAEPRRVSAASVREAMGKNRSSRLPVWLALAAALIVGLLVNRREILPAQNSPRVAVTGPVDLAPTPTPTTSPTGDRGTPVEEVSRARRGQKPRMVRAAADLAAESQRYEGLPRLTIAPIDFSPATTTAHLDTDAIEITGLEIAPLVVPSLSPEPENR
jgi:hypothetical protein